MPNANLNRRRFLGQTASAAAISAGLTSSTVCATGKPDRIKVGQIGVGHAHANKLGVYLASDDYEVVGLAEEDPRLQAVADAKAPFRDVPRMSKDQLLQTPGLSAVLVETEVRDCLDVAEECIDRGLHVHLDKPAGESLPQFRRILASAQRQGLTLQMGYMYRFNPAVLLMREMLKKGWLGEVFEVHTVMSKVVNAASRQQLAEYPGGIMFELGCHIMDLAIGVLGKPSNVQSFARHSSAIDDDLVDNMLAVLSYPKATATVKSSALEVEGFARRHFVVCGSEGTFHIQPLDNPTVRVAFSRPRDNYQRGYQEIKFPRYSRYVGDAADMAKIIRAEKESEYGYDHDLTVQQTLLQASGLPLT